MRETAIMDFLSNVRDGSDSRWVPTSEKVIASTELTEGGYPEEGQYGEGTPAEGDASRFLTAPGTRFEPPVVGSGNGADQPRPAGFGPPRVVAAMAAHPGAAPAPDDPDALEDLTYEQLAKARGLDPATSDPLSKVKLKPRPARPAAGDDLAGRPTPEKRAAAPARPGEGSGAGAPGARPPAAAKTPIGAARTPAARRPASVSAAALIQPIPTWPPAGAHVERPPARLTDKNIGPVPSRRRPSPGRRTAGRVMIGLLLLLVALVAAWYFLVKERHGVHPALTAPAVTAPAAHVAASAPS